MFLVVCAQPVIKIIFSLDEFGSLNRHNLRLLCFEAFEPACKAAGLDPIEVDVLAAIQKVMLIRVSET